MNIENAILKRRSIRRFKDEKVEKESIDEIIEAGIWAPTGGNAQARVFIAITDPAKLRAVRNYSPGILGKPPLIIAVGTDKVKAQRYGGIDWIVSATMDNAMAVQNMMLRAWGLGIGSCPFLSFDRKRLVEELQIPDSVSLDLLVTFGKPAFIGNAPKRTKDLIFSEVYGRKYEGSIKETVKIDEIRYVTFEKEHLLDLLTYIIFSAKALSGEPKEYGIFRLIEVAGRLVDNYPNVEKNEIFIKIKAKLDRLRFGEMLPSEELDKEVEEISKLL